MACPKCGHHTMRLVRGGWECASPKCDYREGGVKKVSNRRGLYVFSIDPAVTQRELRRVHDMPMEDVIRASGRGR